MRNCYSGCVYQFFGPFVICLQLYCLVLSADAFQEQYAVVGRRAAIPCNITDSTVADTVTLVLWYKGDAKLPIYTLDARKGPLEKARHFPGNELITRAVFDVTLEPAVLYLDPVHAEDDGIYKCRTEFKRSRTETDLVRLHVVVPPQEVIITDEFGQRLKDVIGPYDEGSRVAIYCEAEGIPAPSVVWWKDGDIIDESSVHTTQGYIRNELVLSKLQRSELLASYTCQASNTNMSAPVSSTVSIDMNLRPLDVRITTLQRPLSAGKKFLIQCESWGARPKTLITWWLDRQKLQSTKETNNANVTTSILSFTPSTDDNGKILSCRAQNPSLKDNVIENGWTLNIHYIPELRLSFGANIQPHSIKEGSDVFFECRVVANPPVTDVKWFFEERPLFSNATAGIIVSNLSLVLQRVKKDHRGRYQCGATNTEGEGRSQHVMLRVRYAPICVRSPTAVHGVARYEAVNASCIVDADPPEVSFSWSLNNTVENVDVSAYDTVNGTTSVVVYTPGTMFGYGVLLCWGRNVIGPQKEPCIIKVIPAGPPESVKGCTVSNQTSSSLFVECEPAYDGGMHQMFHLEVYNSAEEHLHLNLSSNASPVFHVKNLPHSSSFILVLYASNGKGKSSSVALMASTSHPPERRTTLDGQNRNSQEEDAFPLSPLSAILISVLLVAVSISLAVFFVIRRRGRHRRKTPPIEEETLKYEIPLKKDLDDFTDSAVESPDVIPNTNESTSRGDDSILIKSVDAYDLPKNALDYSYDFVSDMRTNQQLQEEQAEDRDSESRCQESFRHTVVPSCERAAVVASLDSPTDYAELDFQKRLGMAPCTKAVQKKEYTCRAEDGHNFSFLHRSPHRSKESLSIPETTTETTPL